MRPIIIFRISPKLKRKIALFLFFLVLFITVVAGTRLISTFAGRRSMAQMEPLGANLVDKVSQIVASSGVDYKQVLLETMPILATTLDLQAMSEGKSSQGGLWDTTLNPLNMVSLADPQSLLDSQLTILKMVERDEEPIIMEEEDEEEYEYIPEVDYDNLVEPPAPPPSDFIKSDKPLVAIYTTHNSETYIPTDGKSKLEGKNAGVAKVAQKLAEELESIGVKTIRSTTIHDYPSFTKSYGNSLKTVQTMLAENPSVQVVIDVHRDAGVPKKETIKINGQDTAKILLIVGSNARAEHPHWEKNRRFAATLVQKMNELYPGLSKGYRVQSGRYNQHLHPRAILIEVGSEKNSLEEAQRAVALFADVLAKVLAELQQEKL